MKRYKNFNKINELVGFGMSDDEDINYTRKERKREKEKSESVDKNIHLSNKYFDDLAKVSQIIKSCKTEEQTESAYNVYNLWKKKWATLFVKPIPYYFWDDIRIIEELLNKKFQEFDEVE